MECWNNGWGRRQETEDRIQKTGEKAKKRDDGGPRLNSPADIRSSMGQAGGTRRRGYGGQDGGRPPPQRYRLRRGWSPRAHQGCIVEMCPFQTDFSLDASLPTA